MTGSQAGRRRVSEALACTCFKHGCRRHQNTLRSAAHALPTLICPALCSALPQVSNLVAAEKLHFYEQAALYTAVRIATAATPAETAMYQGQ